MGTRVQREAATTRTSLKNGQRPEHSTETHPRPPVGRRVQGKQRDGDHMLQGSGRGGGKRGYLRGRSGRELLAVLCIAGLASALATILAGPVVASSQQSLAQVGVAPARPAGATDLGSEAGESQIRGEVVLRPRGEHALESFVEGVGRRGSPDFGRYLDRGEFAARFGPSPRRSHRCGLR